MLFTHRHYRLICLLITALFAPQVTAAEPDTPPEVLDRIWNGNRLYHNPDGPGIQTFDLVGRYHGQYWSVDAQQGEADGWDNRRIIFGFDTRLNDDFKIQAQMHVNDSFSPVYKGLYVGFIEWAPKGEKISTRLGRLDYVYTGMERSTSSNSLVTFERAALVNQLMPGEVFGLYSKKSFAETSIQAGLFTGATKEEFGDLDAGLAALLGIATDLPLGYETGRLHLDYLYNDGDKDNTSFKPYQRIVSLWHEGNTGAFGLGMDLTVGWQGLNQSSSVWGLTLLPTYSLVQNWLIGGDELQFASRYHLANSRENNGLNVPKRYEQSVSSGAGERYQSVYLGVNYLLYGNKFKFMAGAEYADMDDTQNDGGAYQGWTYLAGIRFHF